MPIEALLQGKVALVTGAAKNLPQVIARTFAESGATVAVNDIVASGELERVVVEIQESGGRALAVYADVSRRDALEGMIGQVKDQLGCIDILVNGVGPYVGGKFLDLPEGDWDHVMDTTLKAVYMLTQLVAPDMIEKRWGRVINFSAGSADYRTASVYALAKSGVRFLTECLALELGPAITVNAISPGQIAESSLDVSAIDSDFVKRAIQRTPIGRLVTRREVAEMAVLLCSPAFASVTGQTIKMDGGWSIAR